MVGSGGAAPVQTLRHCDCGGITVHVSQSCRGCKRSETTLAHSAANKRYTVLEQARPVLRVAWRSKTQQLSSFHDVVGCGCGCGCGGGCGGGGDGGGGDGDGGGGGDDDDDDDDDDGDDGDDDDDDIFVCMFFTACLFELSHVIICKL
jgi:hypothetical protein